MTCPLLTEVARRRTQNFEYRRERRYGTDSAGGLVNRGDAAMRRRNGTTLL
jgi:hypothetical protein